MNPIGIGRPIFISTDEAMAYHELSIAQFGGGVGLRDADLLESALSQARTGFGEEYAHQYPFEMAAAYAFHIAKNHPFVDGNKRTALMCCGAFLRKNGWNLTSVGVEAADAILALIAGSLDKRSFAAWLASHCVARPSFELRDFMSKLSYERLANFFDSMVGQRQVERVATTIEAHDRIPAILQANLGAKDALDAGNVDAASRLHAQSHLMVAMYRLAEDMGYEW